MVTTEREERGQVGYLDMRAYMAMLEDRGLLKRISVEVDLKFEVGAIAARALEQHGPALLFENVRGYPGMPLVCNLISNIEQVAVAFNTEPDEGAIHRRVVHGMNNRLASEEVPRSAAPCKQVVIPEEEIDIFAAVPTPWWHELDGGQYLGTTAGIVTRDPITGILNMGAYRIMLKERRTVSMSGGVRGRTSSTGPGGGDHILSNEEMGRPTPIAIVMGMDPLLTMANGSPVAPGGSGLQGSMEYEAAGGWRGAPTELVACEASDLLVPAHAEMVIEGEVVPNERTTEGPHGESTGFYGENRNAFVIKIKRITHRKSFVTYGLICQRVEDYPRQLLRSGSMQSRLISRTGMTNIRAVYFPEVGRHGMLIVSAEIRDASEPQQIMSAIWSIEPWRWIVVVDEDCNVRDWEEVFWRVTASVEPGRDMVHSPIFERAARSPGEVDFDPPGQGVGINASMKFKESPTFPPVNKVRRELMQQVAERWSQYGL
jgi:4-hydroxy-3-polyprenylbenzoate decarboxylase